MLQKRSTLRAMISLFVAVVFAIAANPGSMAMPARHDASPHAMASHCADATASSCDHMKVKSEQEQGNACKDMAVCVGMLGCFGMAAVAAETVCVAKAVLRDPVVLVHRTQVGQTIPPDDRPPIA